MYFLFIPRPGFVFGAQFSGLDAKTLAFPGERSFPRGRGTECPANPCSFAKSRGNLLPIGRPFPRGPGCAGALPGWCETREGESFGAVGRRFGQKALRSAECRWPGDSAWGRI